MRGRAGAVVVAASLLLGCGARTVSKLPAAPGRAAAKSPPAWRLAVYPAPTGVTFVERLADGTQRMLVGGLRAEQRGDDVVFSHDSALAPLLRACHSDGGFLYYARGGELFWSETFLGPLVPSGGTNFDWTERLVQCGPVVLALTKNGHVARISRHGTAVIPEHEPPLTSLRFSTPELGRALAAPDRLFETHDGGKTFSEPPSRPPAALDEPVAWLGGDPTLPRLPEIYRDSARPAFLAWLRRALESEAGRLTSGIRLTDGTWVRLVSQPMEFYLGFRRPDGRITTFEVKGGLCDVLPWGTKVVVACSEGADAVMVFSPNGREPFPQPAHRPQSVIADPAGRYMALSAWPDDDMKPGTPGPRSLFDGTAWRDLDALEKYPLAIRQGRLLLTQDELDQSGTPRSYYLPANAGVAGLADQLHGLRFDRHRAPDVTNDGGKHFEPLIANTPSFDWGSDLRCWQHGCALGDQLAYTDEPFTDERWLSAGPPPSEQDEDLPPASAPAQADVQQEQAPEPYRSPMEAPPTNAPTFRCQASPALPKQQEFLERLFKLQTSPDGKQRFDRATALGGLLERQGDGLSWRGRDAAGDFSVQTPPLSGAGRALANPELQLAPAEFAVKAGIVAPLFVARGFALLLQLEEDTALLFVVRADGKTELLRSGSLDGFELIPAASGGVALLASQQNYDGLFALDPSGAVWARRWLVAPHGQLALGAAGPLEVVAKPGGRADVYWAQPGSPPQDLPFDANSAFAPCTRPTAPDAWLMLAGGFDGPRVVLEELSSSPFVYPTHWAAPSTALGLLERTARGSCLRGVIMSQPFVAQLAPTSNGGMTGTLVGPDVNHSLSCTRERPGTRPPAAAPHKKAR